MENEYKFDAIVVGAGHAGCEASLALARMNKKTLLTQKQEILLQLQLLVAKTV